MMLFFNDVQVLAARKRASRGPSVASFVTVDFLDDGVASSSLEPHQISEAFISSLYAASNAHAEAAKVSNFPVVQCRTLAKM